MNFFKAILDNNIDTVKKLLYSGLDINIQDNEKDTALHKACKKNKIELIKLLLAHPDIDVNITNENENKNTALYHACNRNNIKIVKLLLEHPKIKLNPVIFRFKNKPQINSLLKNRENQNSSKVNQILNNIEE